MKEWAPFLKTKSGFTIVELLIVIVVIAILAAISIAAYTGIQNRARDTALQSASSQAGKKVLAYAPLNTDMFPDEASYRADLSIPTDTEQATYDYYVSTNKKSFCLSVTNTTTNPLTAYAYTQTGQTVPGRCVKNLVANPGFEAINGALVNGITASGRATVETSTIGVVNGTKSVKVTSIFSGSRDTFVDLSNWGVQANKNYTVLVTYTLENALVADGPRFRFNIAGADMSHPGGSLAVGTRQIAWTFSTNAGASPVSFLRLMPGSKLDEPPTYFDNLMVIEGTQQMKYGDGSFANWAWVGAPNASASFGPTTAL